MNETLPDLTPLKDAVVGCDAKLARRLTNEALAAGVPPEALLGEALIPAMTLVGQRFEAGEYFVPDLLLAARAMKAAVEPIRPLLAAAGVEPAGRVVIGTVKGDLHDIGKNLVAAMLEGGGFQVVDLGADVAPAAFVAAVERGRPTIVALSALLSTTMTAMKDTIDALEAAGVRAGVKVMAGGAPVTEPFARSIGADGYADNAAAAVALARRLRGPALTGQAPAEPPVKE
jgi:5-methyltetrahydrofolate--homocysteine methyltransferase